MATDAGNFADWFFKLRELAETRNLAWLVSADGQNEREAFSKGLSPADYLDRFEAMSEWRGCGCGGA